MIRSLDLICAITKAVEELRMASKVPPYLGKRNTVYLMLSEPECSCLLEMNSVYWDSVTYPSSRSMQTVKQIPTFSWLCLMTAFINLDKQRKTKSQPLESKDLEKCWDHLKSMWLLLQINLKPYYPALIMAMNQALMMNSERKFDAKPICNDFAKKNAA